jgi:hypothetical protein
MLRALAALLVLTLFGCAHGNVRLPARAGERNAMRVDYVWPDVDTQPLNAWTWRASKWHCANVLYTPALVIVSGLNACVLDNLIVDVPLKNSYFACPHRWVTPSNAC